MLAGKIIKTGVAAAVLCLAAELGAAVLADNFETYAFGQADAVTAVWKGMPAGFAAAVIEADPADAANRVLRVSAAADGVQGNGVYGILPVEAHIPNGTTRTLFLRFMAGSATTNQSFGLTNIDTPVAGGSGNWGDFRVQIGLVNGELRARDGGDMRALAAVAPGQWYNLWAVVDNGANTFRLYLNQGVADAKEADRLTSGAMDTFAFRTGTTETLDRFLWRAQPQAVNPAVRIDDIYMLDGEELSNPLRIDIDQPFWPDINQDHFVDFADMVLLADVWLDECAEPDWCGRADLNKSGRVDMADFDLLARQWLTSAIAGLTAWWPLNEGSGSVVYDVIGNNNGILYNIEPDDWIATGSGYVLGLDAEAESDGRGEYLRLPPVIRDDFTISLWVRTNQFAPKGQQWWHGKGLIDATTPGFRNDFGLALLWDKAAFGVNGPETGDVTIQSITAINDGYWHHIAATRDSATGAIALYVNGVPEAVGTGAVGTLSGPSRILVGSVNLLSGRYLRGYFDDIRFYDRALSTEEVFRLSRKNYPPVTPKKGVGANMAMLGKIAPLRVCWFYNWGVTRPSSPSGVDSSLDYVPMIWGSSLTGLNNLDSIGEVHYLLGFNEPDLADQANMTVSAALQRWPQIQAAADARNLLLGSPSASHYNRQWIVDFMDAVDAPGSGLRVDFMTVHWYSSPNADLLMDNLTWVYNKWGRDVWLTEFNVARWDGNNTWTQEQTYTFLAEALYRMEKTPWLKRYAIFPWEGTSNASQASPIYEPGTTTLTPLGRLYAAWDGDVGGPQAETWYFLNNKAGHRRLRFTGSVLEMETIWFMGDWVQWETVDAGNNRIYLRNKGFGTCLAFNSAANQFFMAEPSDAGDAAQWTLTESQHGWYFIDHPASGRRLSRSGNTIAMGLQTYTSDNERWRFIKP